MKDFNEDFNELMESVLESKYGTSSPGGRPYDPPIEWEEMKQEIEAVIRADERERCIQKIENLRVKAGLNHYHGVVLDGIIKAIRKPNNNDQSNP